MTTTLSLYKERSLRNSWRHCGQVMNWPAWPAKNTCLGRQRLCDKSFHIVYPQGPPGCLLARFDNLSFSQPRMSCIAHIALFFRPTKAVGQHLHQRPTREMRRRRILSDI